MSLSIGKNVMVMIYTQMKNKLPIKFKDADKVSLFFHDEAPQIGSGYRSVYVIVGRKWAFIHCPFTGATKKFIKSIYENILAMSERRQQR